jgi:hypothetical protein
MKRVTRLSEQPIPNRLQLRSFFEADASGFSTCTLRENDEAFILAYEFAAELKKDGLHITSSGRLSPDAFLSSPEFPAVYEDAAGCALWFILLYSALVFASCWTRRRPCPDAIPMRPESLVRPWRTHWHGRRKRGKVESNSVFYYWRNPETIKGFRSGVSLHGHTSQSRETLKFLACLGSRFALMRRLMQRLEQRCEANHGRRVDYSLSYWTPPAPPEIAFRLESGQIEKLDLAPIVSLTDHDSIQAPLLLEAALADSRSPVSVEWTVPYGPQAFHLGVHNLPRTRTAEWMQILASYTAHPSGRELKEILAALHAEKCSSSSITPCGTCIA